MSLDGLVLSAITKELQDVLTAGRIDKIQQPTEQDLILTIRSERTNYRLLLCANKSYPRVHIVSSLQLPNPAQAPMLCMLMRKHIEGGRIRSITQFGRERILFIDVDAYNELGDKVVRRIVVELMGRHSNILLLDQPDGIILEATTHTSHAVNRHREVLPGRAYVYPPVQDKVDPFQESKDNFLSARLQSPLVPLKRYLIAHYFGVGPFFADEFVSRVEHTDSEQTHEIMANAEWEVFATLIAKAQAAKDPTILRDEWGTASDFYIFPPTHVVGTQQSYESVNQCVEDFYQERALADIARSKTGAYIRLVRTEWMRVLQKIEKFETLLASQEDAEMWRVTGELLTAYIHQLKKGDRTISLPNFYDDERLLAIELDPAKTPLENANAYYKRYSKYKKGRDITKTQLDLARTEATYLESVLHELESCQIEDVKNIELELQEVGLLKRSAKQKKQPSSKMTSIKHATFYATDGTPIFVGRNNRENDQLTLKIAKKTDTWLHAKDIPGSHVIISSPSPTEETIYEGAMLAGYFSKHRDAGKVEVDVVLVKNIWQPNQARPGFVLFEGQRTIVARLEPHAIATLLESSKRH